MMSWMDYRSKHGPLAMAERLEYALAQVAFYVASAGGMKKQGGGKLKIKDFLPYHKDEPLGIAQVMNVLGGKTKGKKGG